MWYSWWSIVWSFEWLQKLEFQEFCSNFFPIFFQLIRQVPQTSKSLDLPKSFHVKSIIRLNDFNEVDGSNPRKKYAQKNADRSFFLFFTDFRADFNDFVENFHFLINCCSYLNRTNG
jgi:hypothetical protein